MFGRAVGWRLGLVTVCFLGIAAFFLALVVTPASPAHAVSNADGDVCTIVGTAGADVLSGTSRNDVICGLGGNDKINGGAGDDRIDGGSGNDSVSGSSGNDQLMGGDGNDVMVGGPGDDRLDGGPGVDRVSYGSDGVGVRVDVGAGTGVGAGVGRDTLAGVETVTGGGGDDVITGGPGNETLTGGVGRDQVNGGAGNDILDGGPDDDRLDGGPGVDRVSYGSDGVGVRVDVGAGTGVGAGVGRDTLAGVETVTGGGGDDVITGGPGNETLAGGAGRDQVNGGAGNDVLDGGPGDDRLDGGPGVDRVNGGLGRNVCTKAHGDTLLQCAITVTLPVDEVAVLSGRVVGAGGVPAVGLGVLVEKPGGGSGFGLTDEAGEFAIGVPRGDVSVTLYKPDPSKGPAGLPDWFTFRGTVSVAGDQRLDMTLPVARQVTFRVVDGAGGAVAGAQVYGLDQRSADSVALWRGGPVFSVMQTVSRPRVTGVDGKAVVWAFPSPNVGTVYVDYSAPGGSLVRTTIPDLAVTTDDSRSVKLDVGLAVLSGRVVGAGGVPAVGLGVLVEKPGGGSGFGLTDEAGEFAIGVPRGDVSVTLYKPDPSKGPAGLPDWFTFRGMVTVAGDQRLDMTLPVARQVTFRVVDGAGGAVAGAQVYGVDQRSADSVALWRGGPVFSVMQTVSRPRVTGVDGKAVVWAFPSPNVGTVYVDYSAPGGSLVRTTIPDLAVTTDASRSVKLDVGQAVLSGRVVGAGGVPAVGLGVLVEKPGGGSGFGLTDEAGEFAIGVPRGDVSVTLYKPDPSKGPAGLPDWFTFRGTVTVAGDQRLDMTLPVARQVTFRVVDGAGGAVAGAQVYGLDQRSADSVALWRGGPVFSVMQTVSRPRVTGVDGKAVVWAFPSPNVGTVYVDYSAPGGSLVRTTIPDLAVTTDATVPAKLAPPRP